MACIRKAGAFGMLALLLACAGGSGCARTQLTRLPLQGPQRRAPGTVARPSSPAKPQTSAAEDDLKRLDAQAQRLFRRLGTDKNEESIQGDSAAANRNARKSTSGQSAENDTPTPGTDGSSTTSSQDSRPDRGHAGRQPSAGDGATPRVAVVGFGAIIAAAGLIVLLRRARAA
jgi:hypothetical protein